MANVTITGTPITDAFRALGVEGDGLTNDGSYGIWQQATNRVTNGGFETNSTGWSSGGASVFARSGAWFKFGSQSMYIFGTIANSDVSAFWFSDTASPGDVLTVSCWVNVIQAASTNVKIRIQFWDGPNGTGAQTGSADSSPAVGLGVQKLQVTGTAPASTVSYNLRIFQVTTGTQTAEWYFDGVQSELFSLATPYVHTDGGTATRTAARAQVPSSLLDSTQGWWACRVRTGFASTDVPYASRSALLWWGDSSNVRMCLTYDPSSDQWGMIRTNVGSGVVSSVAQSFSVGTALTLVAAWTSSTISISVNGGSFVSAANTDIPRFTSSLIDIGTRNDSFGQWFNGDFHWVAFGTTSPIQDVHARIFHALPNTLGSNTEFPIQASFVWDASTAAYGATSNPPAVLGGKRESYPIPWSLPTRRQRRNVR